MKILVVIAALAVVGCSNTDRAFVASIVDDTARIPSISDTTRWGEDRWQPPEYTIANGGDCEDHVIVAMTALRDVGIVSFLVAGTVDEWNHAWLEVDGVGYDPTFGGAVVDKPMAYTAKERYAYWEIAGWIDWSLE